MRKKLITIITAIALFGGILSANVSNAGQPSSSPVQEQSLLDVSGFGQSLSSDNLNALSGRQAVSVGNLDIMSSTSNVNGTQNGNSLLVGENSALNTGYNSVSGSAFVGANGFSTVIQNSGNQVLIQNDLIVNLNMH